MWSSVSWMQLVLLLVSSLTAHDEWMYCVKQGSFCSSWAWTENAKARWVLRVNEVGLLLLIPYDRKNGFESLVWCVCVGEQGPGLVFFVWQQKLENAKARWIFRMSICCHVLDGCYSWQKKCHALLLDIGSLFCRVWFFGVWTEKWSWPRMRSLREWEVGWRLLLLHDSKWG